MAQESATVDEVKKLLRRTGRMVKKQNEAAFTKQVLEYAKLRGWRSAHFRPAKTNKGWRTAVSGDGVGFPDLILVRGNQIIAAELKVGKNTLRPEQREWLEALRSAGAWVQVWRPENWSDIESVLR